MPVTQKILILYAHPNQEASVANERIRYDLENIQGITLVDLYRSYPRFDIDVEQEQRRLEEHDVIFFMFPMFWYSTPSILKEWQDLVLQYGFAYGHEGCALHGKYFGSIITTGASESDYSEMGSKKATIFQMLKPLEAMSDLCGLRYLPPATLYSARLAEQENRLDTYCLALLEFLQAVVEGHTDLKELSPNVGLEHQIGVA